MPIVGRALLLTNRISVAGPRYDRNDREGAGLPDQRETPPALLWDIVLSGQEARWGLSYAIGVYNAFDARWAVPARGERARRRSRLAVSADGLLALATPRRPANRGTSAAPLAAGRDGRARPRSS